MLCIGSEPLPYGIAMGGLLDGERPFIVHWGNASSRNSVSDKAAPTVIPQSGQSLFHNGGRNKNKFPLQWALQYSNAREPNNNWYLAIRAPLFFPFSLC